MQYGLFQTKNNDGIPRLEVWQLPANVLPANYAKRINAILVSVFPSREEAESARTREEEPDFV